MRRHIYKIFSSTISSNFRYQTFVPVFRYPGGKIVVLDDVLSSHEQKISPTTSLVWSSNGMEPLFSFKSDVLGFETEVCQGCRGYETYIKKQVKKQHIQKARADEETVAEEDQETPVPRAFFVKTFCTQFFFRNWGWHQQSPLLQVKETLCTKILFFQQLQGGHLWIQMSFCSARDTTEQFRDEILESLLSGLFFTRRTKILSRPNGFMLYDKLGVDFFTLPNCYIQLWKVGYD